MGAKYPAQSNLQTTWAMRDELDAVAQLSETSRAEIARECFEEALHAVMLRRRVGVARVRKLAAEIAAAREQSKVESGNDGS